MKKVFFIILNIIVFSSYLNSQTIDSIPEYSNDEKSI